MAAIALITAYPRTTLGVDQQVGTVTEVRGPVSLRRPGEPGERSLVRGDAVHVGDVVAAGVGGRAQVALADDSLVTLSQRSEARINQFSFDPRTNRRTAVVRVIAGNIRVTVFTVRSPDSDLAIQSDTALVVIDNLADCIVTSRAGGSEVIVLERSLRVRNVLPYVIDEVSAGVNQKVSVRENQPPAVPVTVSIDERRKYMKEFIVR